MLLFTLKKVTGGLLLPLPFLLIVMAIGILLLWFSRWQKTGKIILSSAWLILLLISLQPVADRLLKPIEQHYPTWNGGKKVDYIVVLGGGYTWNPEWAPGSNLINNSLPRLVEGVRQWRDNPGSKMIFTGYAANGNPVSTAEAGARVAQTLGVPPEAIITLSKPRDTEEEAFEVKQVTGSQPLLLVTSASHMQRAMNFFHAQGLTPIAAPANQMAIDSPLNWWEKAIPAALYLGHSERVWYESLGLAWQWLKGDQPSVEPGQ
ncbi:envelope biogenesis factor ElyC [Erwiniaceae bacterium BAC15a-03b]|uniref:Envelope biogenesis factor ElyC n=1 Tax=Winslowiella arboricola TaxID=2978220 RepID=A0A9J6PV22_9GAMM|nr:envelope biogenesis factor ElyC [Winslowiella arboricola]MCU5775035.1 envelope biogenesis factor ElyC [Winslowiella arboricola]MCU5780510.1 envelope biogenesis factor ElyC [Winslowiella arboricola]